ncbi:MAG TPA: Lrp/AsnC family transcriptional regulator [Accumulibacter sp.]|uniref:siroheme decarboxylase n=3 Tax=Candidatus Accumulibacter TaxID=327159 RepID=A0A080MDB9_9PROT|nr:MULTISPECIES: Lrp/AsnC family transcriptional regulator [Candidatus Accumulibacter]KFB75209.1 MAG: leucine-responsive transcriptional regulator [Candidatus Accumulibacter cognatus]MCM8621846.1 Lrp/AsnC family transcriptional regulator [Accumulibacter sp.]QLH50849.1 MAG: Lrp/AsnC family transcriptional regulator [Candidatus Accumulibacter cognatus]TMQ75407.1 Heme d1 biosynthesis protein NirD / Heme d1 biosynthesis protein NirL [Candidatus Accumulibacter phosphatis]HMW56463.1 Lrp/AsnC family 
MDKLDDAIDFRLLNDFQRDFPLCSAPFAELASRLGVAEGVVLRALEGLRRQGKIARVGAIFAPKRIGVSTLAAMAVPAAQLAAIAEVVNRFPEVNHNYEREHHYNLWFVATAGSEGRLQAALGAIEQVAGWPVLKLPLLEEYHIDLGFALDGQGESQGSMRVRSQAFTAPTPLDEFERRLVMALQEGLPLFIRPFSVLASRVGCEEREVLERIRRWCAEGIIKRFGVVVRHHELGYTANAMLVHDIPDASVSAIGERLACESGVNLCYRRPRVLPSWRYNLFCMIHGQARAEVEARIAELRARLQLTDYAHAVLFSLTRFKQRGARYA